MSKLLISDDPDIEPERLVSACLELFSNIEDPRSKGLINHSLDSILFISICAMLSGVKSINGIANFAKYSFDWLSEYIEMAERPPSHDTIGRVLSVLNSKIMEQLLLDVVDLYKNGSGLNKKSVTRHLAIDGKSIARSATVLETQASKNDGGKQPVMTVNAYDVSTNICVACAVSKEPGSEFASIHRLLSKMDLSNTMVSVDAGHARAKVVKIIQEQASKRANYTICIKGNNAKSYSSLENIFSENSKRKSEQYKDEGSRKDFRLISVIKINNSKEDDKILKEKWSGVKTMIRVERHRTQRSSPKLGEARKVSIHVVYYLSSKKMNAKEAANVIRKHWYVENKLHWVLDVHYGEDSSQARQRNLAKNLAIIRRIANNYLARATGKTLNLENQMKFTFDLKFRDQVLKFDA